MITTWRFRIKDSGHEKTILEKMARSVNKVWNLCKEKQVKALEENSTKKILDKTTGLEKEVRNYISSFDFDKKFSGKSRNMVFTRRRCKPSRRSTQHAFASLERHFVGVEDDLWDGFPLKHRGFNSKKAVSSTARRLWHSGNLVHSLLTRELKRDLFLKTLVDAGMFPSLLKVTHWTRKRERKL